MRKFTHFLAIGAISTCLGTGCASLYIPPAAQTPQLQHKGDFRGAAVVGYYNGLDVQFAYAPSNGFGVMGAFSTSINAGAADSSHSYGEIGAGWFLPDRKNLILGAYGGIGFGKAVGRNPSWCFIFCDSPIRQKGSYVRPFVQGNIGIHTKQVDAGFVMRLADVLMRYQDDYDPFSLTKPPPKNTSAFFLSPIVYLGVGHDPIKVYVQSGMSFPLGDLESFDYAPINMSLGIAVNLNLLQSAKGVSPQLSDALPIQTSGSHKRDW